VVQIGAESRPCPPPGLRACGDIGARRSMDMSWASGSAVEFARSWRSRDELEWLTVVRNVRALCRAEYVMSKDPVNAWHWSQD
jgi:hypothetical protein